MRISEIQTIPFELSMKGVLRWGQGSQLDTLKHALVKIISEDGTYGIAEAPIRPTIYGETLESVQAIISLFNQSLQNIEVEDTQAISKILHGIRNNNCAKGALDIAWHDLRCKLQGKTLFDVYSGPNQKIRVSYILGISDFTTMLQEAREVFAAGVSVFKIKIGRDAAHDREIVGALQSEFSGEDVILYADANETLQPQEAPKRLEQLADLGIAYIEEPLPVHLIKQRAALKAQNILPIIADDSCFTPTDLTRELDFDTFDILNIKTARTGFSDSLTMLENAKSANKGVMLGSQASAGWGTVCCALIASQSGVDYPSELSFPIKLHQDILQQKVSYDSGYLDISSSDFRAARLIIR